MTNSKVAWLRIKVLGILIKLFYIQRPWFIRDWLKASGLCPLRVGGPTESEVGHLIYQLTEVKPSDGQGHALINSFESSIRILCL